MLGIKKIGVSSRNRAGEWKSHIAFILGRFQGSEMHINDYGMHYLI